MRKKWMVIAAAVTVVASLAVAGMAGAHASKSGATSFGLVLAFSASASIPLSPKLPHLLQMRTPKAIPAR